MIILKNLFFPFPSLNLELQVLLLLFVTLVIDDNLFLLHCSTL